MTASIWGGGQKYQSPIERGLGSITVQSYEKVYDDQGRFMSKLAGDVSFLAANDRKQQAGIDQANQNFIQQFQGMITDAISLLGGGGDTGFDFGDFRYVLIALGALFGFTDGSGHIKIPPNFFEAAWHLFSNYILPVDNFKDAINEIVDTLIATVLGIFGDVPIVGQALEQFAEVVSDLRDLLLPLLDAIQAFLGIFSIDLGTIGDTGGMISNITSYFGPLKPIWDALVTALIGIELPDFAIILHKLLLWGIPFVDDVFNTVTALKGWLTDTITMAGGEVKNIVEALFELVSALGPILDLIGDAIPVLAPITSGLSGLLDSLGPIVDNIVNVIDNIDPIVNQLTGVVGMFADIIPTPPVGWDPANSATNFFTHWASYFIGTWVPGNIPGLDASKITSGTFAAGLLQPLIDAVSQGFGGSTGLNFTTLKTFLLAIPGVQALIDGIYNFLTGGSGTGHTIAQLVTAFASFPATAISGILTSGNIPGLDASKIISGALNVLRIPNLDVAKITTGVFGTGFIPSLDVSKITSGVFGTGFIPSLDVSKITTGVFGSGFIPSLDASKITSGKFLVTQLQDLVDAVSQGFGGTTGLTFTTLKSFILGLPTAQGVIDKIYDTITSTAGTGHTLADIGTALAALPASFISGVLTAANIPGLDASKIITGAFVQSLIPSLTSGWGKTVDASFLTGAIATGVTIVGNAVSTLFNGSGFIGQLQGSATFGSTALSTFFTNITAVTGALKASGLTGAINTGVTFLVGASNVALSTLLGNFNSSGLFDSGKLVNLTGTVGAALISALDASKITTGTFGTGLIPGLDVSKIISGVFGQSFIPSLTGAWGNTIAGSLLTGAINTAVTFLVGATPVALSTLLGGFNATGGFDAAKILNVTGNLLATIIPGLDASKIITGTFGTGLIPNLAASIINSGTFNEARIPSLDGSWGGTIATSLLSGAIAATSVALSGITGLATGIATWLGSGGALPTATTAIASQIISGIFGTGFIPSLDASKITTGVFGTGFIPSLDVSKITTGVFGTGFIPSLDVSKITTGIFGSGFIPGLDAAKIITGTFANSFLPGVLPLSLWQHSTTSNNLIISPNFEDNTVTRETTGTGTGQTFGYSTTVARSGTQSFKIQTSNLTSGQNDYFFLSPNTLGGGQSGTLASAIKVQPGQWLYAEIYVRAGASNTASAGNIYLDALLRDSTGVNGVTVPVFGTVPISGLSSSAWTKLSGWYQIPAGYDEIWPTAQAIGANVANQIFYFDDVRITEETVSQGIIQQLFGSTSILGSILATVVPGLDASKIITGALNQLRIPSLTAGWGNTIAGSVLTGAINTGVTFLVGASNVALSTLLGNLDATGKFDSGKLVNLTGTVAAALISALDASKITTGTFAAGLIPALNLITGTLTSGQIPGLDAAKITTGTFVQTLIPSLAAGWGGTVLSSFLSGVLGTGLIPGLDASKIITGVFGTGLIPNLAASIINSGTFNEARIPSLDGSWGGTIATSLLSGAIAATSVALSGITGLATGIATWLGSGGALPTATTAIASQIISGIFGTGFIPSLDASKITTGVFGTGFIPNLDVAKITTGVFGTGFIPNLDVAKITTGVFGTGFIPSLDVSKITTGIFGTGFIPNLDATKITTGTFPLSFVPLAMAQALWKTATQSNTNLVIDPQFTDNTVDRGAFIFGTGGGGGVAYSTTTARSGTQCIAVTTELNTTGQNTGFMLVPFTPALALNTASGLKVQPGHTFYFEGNVKAKATNTSTAGTVGILGYIMDSTGTNTATVVGTGAQVNQSGLSSSAWTKISGYYTIPAGYDLFEPFVWVTGGNAANNVFYIDDVLVREETRVQSLMSSLFGALGNPLSAILAAVVPGLDASKIITGTLAAGLIPALNLITGTLTSGQIPGLDVSKIVSGVFGTGFIPSLDVSKITTGIFGTGFIPNLDATKITTGSLSQLRLPSITTGYTGTIDASFFTGALATGVTIVGKSVATLFNSSGLIASQIAGALNPAVTFLVGASNVALSTLLGNFNTSGLFDSGKLVNITGTVAAALISALDASKITTGTFAAGLIPALNLITGVLTSGQIPSLDAAKITTGTFVQALIPSLAAGWGGTVLSSFLSGVLGTGLIPSLDASKITTGIFGTGFIPNLNASKITAGTFLSSFLPFLGITNAAGSNLAIDPGYEASFWSIYNTTNSTQSTDQAHGGTHSWKTTGTGILYQNATDAGTVNPIHTKPGEKFRFGVWVYPHSANTGTDTILLDLNLTDSTGVHGPNNTFGANILTGLTLGSWQYVEQVLTVPAGYDTLNPLIWLNTVVSTNVYYWDDVLFREETTSQSIISNLWGAVVNPLSTILSTFVPGLDASKIITGTLAAGLIPALNLITGTLTSGQIPGLDVSKITTGVFGTGFIPSLDVSKITTGVFGTGFIPSLDVSKITTGVFGAGFIPSLDASKITTGALSQLRLPSITTGYTGTIDASFFTGALATGVTIFSKSISTLFNSSGLIASQIAGALNPAVTFLVGASNVALSTLLGNFNSSGLFDSGKLVNITGTIAAALVSALDASKITTGTFAAGLIPALNLIAGTLTTGQIPALDVSKITTGVFGTGFIPSLDVSKITTGVFGTGFIPALDAAKITTGTFIDSFVPGLANRVLGTLWTGTRQTNTNLVISPDFQDSTIGRGPAVNTGGSATYSTTTARSGTQCLQFTCGNTAPASETFNLYPVSSAAAFEAATAFKVQPGQTFYAEIWVKAKATNTTTAGNIYLEAFAQDSTGVNTQLLVNFTTSGVSSNVAMSGLSSSAWTLISGYYTIPAGYDRLCPFVWFLNSNVANQVFYCDDALIREETRVQSLMSSLFGGTGNPLSAILATVVPGLDATKIITGTIAAARAAWAAPIDTLVQAWGGASSGYGTADLTTFAQTIGTGFVQGVLGGANVGDTIVQHVDALVQAIQNNTSTNNSLGVLQGAFVAMRQQLGYVTSGSPPANSVAGQAQATSNFVTQAPAARPTKSGIDPTTVGPYDIQQLLNQSTMPVCTATQTQSLFAFIPTELGGIIESIRWMGYPTGGSFTNIQGFYVNISKIDTTSGISTNVYSSPNIVASVASGSSPVWNSFNMPSGNWFAAAQTDIYVAEIVIVGTGSYNVAGFTTNTIPQLTTNVPATFGGKRTVSPLWKNWAQIEPGVGGNVGTIAHTFGATENAVVVTVSLYTAASSLTAGNVTATCGGVAMTQKSFTTVQGSNPFEYLVTFSLIHSGGTPFGAGSQNIVITTPTNASMFMTAISTSHDNVTAIGTPQTAVGSSAAPALTVTTALDQVAVVACASFAAGNIANTAPVFDEGIINRVYSAGVNFPMFTVDFWGISNSVATTWVSTNGPWGIVSVPLTINGGPKPTTMGNPLTATGISYTTASPWIGLSGSAGQTQYPPQIIPIYASGTITNPTITYPWATTFDVIVGGDGGGGKAGGSGFGHGGFGGGAGAYATPVTLTKVQMGSSNLTWSIGTGGGGGSSPNANGGNGAGSTCVIPGYGTIGSSALGGAGQTALQSGPAGLPGASAAGVTYNGTYYPGGGGGSGPSGWGGQPGGGGAGGTSAAGGSNNGGNGGPGIGYIKCSM